MQRWQEAMELHELDMTGLGYYLNRSKHVLSPVEVSMLIGIEELYE